MLPKELFEAFLKTRSKVSHDSSTWPIEWKTIFYKSYERSKKYTLDAPHLKKMESAHGAILSLFKERKSMENFKKGITLSDLLFLCQTACGVKNEKNYSRPSPSAGALYPIELYYINNDNTEGFPSGLYHFSQMKNELAKVKKVTIADIQKLVGSGYTWLNDSSGIFVFTYLYGRNTPKYGWLGVRSGLIEIGAMTQNISLLSPLVGAGTRIVGGFDAELLDSFLEIDGITETSLLIMTIGKQG